MTDDGAAASTGSSNPSTAFAKQEQEPASTEVTEVAPGVLRFQLPISMPGLGHVNTYALTDSEGVTLVDPGLPNADSYRALASRLSDAGFAVGDVTTVVVTHSHPDHYGGARRLMADSGAAMVAQSRFGRLVLAPGVDACSAADPGPSSESGAPGVDACSDPAPGAPGSEDEGESGLRTIDMCTGRHGGGKSEGFRGMWVLPRPWNGRSIAPPLPTWKLALARVGGQRVFRRFVPPAPTRRVSHGETIRAAGREWVCLHTPGHTLDHLCLYDPSHGILLSGDHVLPTITPHIPGVGGGPDPLSGFLSSLDSVAAAGDLALALPAHGHPFEDVERRLDEIRAHHEARLQRLRDALAREGGMTVEALSHELFRPQRWGPMAESEAFAHMEHLRLMGDVSHHVVKGEFVYELSA